MPLHAFSWTVQPYCSVKRGQLIFLSLCTMTRCDLHIRGSLWPCSHCGEKCPRVAVVYFRKCEWSVTGMVIHALSPMKGEIMHPDSLSVYFLMLIWAWQVTDICLPSIQYDFMLKSKIFFSLLILINGCLCRQFLFIILCTRWSCVSVVSVCVS